MWIKDQYGNAINSNELLSLYIVTDPANSTYYVVQANNSVNTNVATFRTGADMTEVQANALYAQLCALLGVFDPILGASLV